ncbi:MAG: GTP cyclohydrolase FolE2 [Phycisphaerales bacterium]
MSISSPNPGTLGTSQRALPDVQGEVDHRRIAINKVGVSNVRYPIQVSTAAGGMMPTVATADMLVSLPADRKGTHMSRFLEVLSEYASHVDPARALELCREMRDRLNADDAFLTLAFPYFINKLAPVTQKAGLVEYDVRIEAESHANHDELTLHVAAAATSLCPCSKEISEFGAHNQRCRIEAAIKFEGSMLIEDVAEILESSASCEVYSVLKRPDEKFVTEEAYKNPKFVEDIVRDLATALDHDERVTWYSISSENYESIHGHNAFARIVNDKRSSD